MSSSAKSIVLSKAKRLLAVILSMVLLLSTNSLSVFAQQATDPPSPLPNYDDYYKEQPAFINTTTNVHHHFYGNQLTTSQEKELYNIMEAELLTSTQSRTSYITFSQPIKLESWVSSNGDSAINAYAVTILHRALDAFRYDHPQFYWITGNSAVDEVTVETIDGVVSIVGASANFQPAGVAQSDATAVKSAMDRIVLEAKKQPAGVYQIKAVHDMLAAEIVYSEQNPLPYRAFQITGAFVDKSGVCEAYAKAFKIICDRLGYTTILVVGAGMYRGYQIPHMWNYIQLNGSWYAIDVTWDDQPGTIHDFFMVGRSTSAPNFGGASFGATHKEEYTFNNINYKSFRYPQLSQGRYSF